MEIPGYRRININKFLWGKVELVEGPVDRVSREEVVKAIREMKAGKAAGPSEVRVEMIAASGKIGIGIMVELCQGVLDGKGMPAEWTLSVMIPIFKGKEDAMSCGAYRESEVARACNEN